MTGAPSYGTTHCGTLWPADMPRLDIHRTWLLSFRPILCLSLLSAGWCRSFASDIRERLLKGDKSSVIVAAHRGDWRNFPENSLEAIDNAIAMGVDIVELDVHRTQDSVLILMRCTPSTVASWSSPMGMPGFMKYMFCSPDAIISFIILSAVARLRRSNSRFLRSKLPVSLTSVCRNMSGVPVRSKTFR